MSDEEEDPTESMPDREAGDTVPPKRRKPRATDESRVHTHRGCGHPCGGAAAPDPRIASLSNIDRMMLAELFNRFVGNRQERIDRNTVTLLTSDEVAASVSAAEKSPHYTGNALGIRALNNLRNGLSDRV
jgi:hypothetical protein